jgi:hypothetical protein
LIVSSSVVKGQAMNIDGQCHCGHITYKALVEPSRVSICHCTDCQSLTGSAFRVTVLTSRENLKITAGEPKVYAKVGDNGRKRLQYFCPECGAPLFTTGEGADGDVWGIRWGSIRQRRELAPTRQLWLRSAAPWIDTLKEVPGCATD